MREHRWSKAKQSSMQSFTKLLGLIAIVTACAGFIAWSDRPGAAQSDVPAAKVKACGVTISACGCTIVSPGFYEVETTLTAPMGTNSDSSCISIRAPNTTLSLKGNNITGPTAASGIGIHLLASAQNSFVDGSNPSPPTAAPTPSAEPTPSVEPTASEMPTPSTTPTPTATPTPTNSMISSWNVGIEDDANNTFIYNLTTNINADTGILIQRAHSVSVSHFTSNGNGSYGVRLSATAASAVSDGTVGTVDINGVTTGNGVAGIYVGCELDKSQKCMTPKGPSIGNRVFANTVMGNNKATGILLQTNAHRNVIIDNSGSGNKEDAQDMNVDCDSNVWTRNMFDLANPSNCIQ
jgi:hypothetical protein